MFPGPPLSLTKPRLGVSAQPYTTLVFFFDSGTMGLPLGRLFDQTDLSLFGWRFEFLHWALIRPGFLPGIDLVGLDLPFFFDRGSLCCSSIFPSFGTNPRETFISPLV